MRINKHDTQGTKPLLSKGELGYDDYTAGGDTGRVYVGTGAENIALAERLESNMMTKAQFNALAEERKANRAGSGFDELGKHNSTIATNIPINEGMWTVPTVLNQFMLGSESTNIGISKTSNPIVCINGVKHIISKINSNTTFNPNAVTLPTAPNIYPYDTVLTAEQIASGVIKHADASNSGLIVNGKFDVDTSGWTAYGGGSITQTSGMLKTQSASDRGRGYQYLTNLVVGKRYVVEAMVASDGVADAGIYCASINNVGAYDYGILRATISETTLKYKKIEFTALTSNLMLCCTTVSSGASTSYSYFDNIAVYPADAISRSDLVFLESWHEDISEKNFVYPLGNVQYLGGNTDGLTGIANGAFTGFETYSNFGVWQTPSALIGKGYVWSSLTEAQRKAFISNPDNNCYLDGDKVIQVRYRVRVVQGLGDSWTKVSPEAENNIDARYSTLNYTDGVTKYVQLKGKIVSLTSDIGNTVQNGFFVTKDKASFYNGVDNGLWIGVKGTNTILDNTSAYDGKCYALPIALVHRKNLGISHPVYNPNGTKKASDENFWYNTAVSFTSISDCFDPSKLLTASGYIGTVSGRPDGLFYDQVHESDITDLRNSSKKVEDYSRLREREFNKLVAGSTRGKEGEVEGRYITITSTTSNTGNDFINFSFTDNIKVKIGDIINVLYASSWSRQTVKAVFPTSIQFMNTFPKDANPTIAFGNQTTRTKSNTLLHCDIIGNPANYPTAWKQSGVFGTPLIIAEDGTSLLPDGAKDSFKLSRKANATPLLCLRSTDSGTTWTSFTPTFNTITNEITLINEPATNLVMVYYQTHTSMAVPVVNSDVLEIGAKVIGANGYTTLNGLANVANTLIGKTLTNSTVDTTFGFWNEVSFTQLPAIEADAKRLSTATRDSYLGKHTTLSLYPNQVSPAVKVFPYLTRLNGKAYLNLVFKEMKHNGTSWGDDSKFNIVDNVSTTTDLNAQTVLIGQKTVELPYFIGADE